MDATFVFTQAERSASFDTQKLGHFAFGVRDYFAESPQMVANDTMQIYRRIQKEIFDQSRLFRKGNPQCLCYYVTTGRWTNDADLVARRNAGRGDIEALGLFRNVSLECIDAEQLQRLYRESQSSVVTEVVFANRTVIPEIPGVEEAYIGLLPASQFLKLVENDSNEVMTSLFYDNVRHWQDWNAVNNEIRDTLSAPSTAVRFPLLNNGVTVVARGMHLTGNKIVLEDYQVVNGCQTSYVLHECRVQLDDRVMIPVRVIATRDDNIKNAIIKATNRQTQVSEDQLFALSEFPKKLEAYFPTFDGKRKLYYERRSRQYASAASVEKVRVISMTALVRAFASMFIKQPHRTTRNYQALLKSIGNEIFNKEHRLEPYYASAYATYKLEYLFRNQTLPSELKPARYHMLLAYRILAAGDAMPRMNSRDMETYCSSLLVTLWDDDKCREIFEKAAEQVRAVAEGNLHRDNIRTEAFTNSLLATLGARVQ